MIGQTLAEVREHFGVREWGRYAPLAVRIFRRVEEDEAGCWIFGGTLRTGYGIITYRTRPSVKVTRNTHRIAWELLVDEIPDGLQIDHLCRVRSCCNPAHLEPVTPRENTLRGTSSAAFYATRDACTNGHPYTADNLYGQPDRQRDCKTCRRDRQRAAYAAGHRTVVRDDQHGTLTGYGYGCRCEPCRAARSARWQKTSRSAA